MIAGNLQANDQSSVEQADGQSHAKRHKHTKREDQRFSLAHREQGDVRVKRE